MYGDNYFIGSSIPGSPGMMNGRNNHISMTFTASWPDTTDLWEEEVNNDLTKYYVDGEWQDLVVSTEKIKVKNQQEYHHRIMYTHRGPLIGY